MPAISLRHRLVAALVGTTLALAACGGDDTTDDTAAAATDELSQPALIGRVGDTSASVAIAVSGDTAWGYICDPAGNAIALTGTVDGTTISLTEPDGTATVTGELVDGTFSGDVSLDGSTTAVTATPASGEGGVFLAYATEGDTTTIGAWIRHDDGDAVGNVAVISSASDGDTSVEEGPADIPPDAVPASLGDRFRCFSAARKVVIANQQPGGANRDLVIAMNRACNKVFGSAT